MLKNVFVLKVYVYLCFVIRGKRYIKKNSSPLHQHSGKMVNKKFNNISPSLKNTMESMGSEIKDYAFSFVFRNKRLRNHQRIKELENINS